MRVYYAHSQSEYKTPKADKVVRGLRLLGLDVVNPSDGLHVDTVVQMYDDGCSSDQVMQYFLDIVDTCDVLVFSRVHGCIDGSITAGVAREIQHAIQSGKLALEVADSMDVLARTLSVGETRRLLEASK